MGNQDREKVRALYDSDGEREWGRLERDVRGRVAYVVHQRFLSQFIAPGDHVLEIGAGPGRFTFALADLGATIDATDFSPVQLELHRQHVAGSDAERAVTSRALLDICDTSRYEDSTYDAVVGFGGPLSYAFEEAGDALSGLFRIIKPGGVVVLSVMSLLGSWRFFLEGVIAESKRYDDDANDLVFDKGDLRHFDAVHICRMFRSTEIVEMVHECGGELIAMSASNWASLGDQGLLDELESDPRQWSRFLDKEVRACCEPGVIDGGTHLLFAARRPLA